MTMLPVVSPVAVGQQLTADGIDQELEDLSRKTEANTEELIKLDEEVKEADKEIQALQQVVDRNTAAAERARNHAEDVRKEARKYARQRLRGTTMDPVTVALGSADPQDAIDRSAYAARITREQEEALGAVAQAQRKAARKHTLAATAEAEARFERTLLDEKRKKLESERANLEQQQDKVRDMVDSLSPAELAKWRAKNNPVTAGLESLIGASGAVDAAMTKVGAPYEWGATGPGSFDCSGLMYWAYSQIGISIPRTSQAQLSGGTPVSRSELQPGDIIGYYPGITHVGMYVGNGQVIHASDYGIPVQVVGIDQAGPYQGAVRY
ncbi:NlpC/P60 family protein [Corynebacterium sp. TAE3-ERU12]|uniref:C40 family peptidase n=1 Tax=Corynebacterium sp. TAE3-ERU12 TaxID=2849491 RepID=UPI00351CC45D